MTMSSQNPTGRCQYLWVPSWRLNSNVLRYEWHLWLARLSASDLYRETEPLVSVLIPTFDRADLLVERALASVLRQTYRRFEVVIVGDACTDHTRTSLERLGD